MFVKIIGSLALNYHIVKHELQSTLKRSVNDLDIVCDIEFANKLDNFILSNCEKITKNVLSQRKTTYQFAMFGNNKEMFLEVETPQISDSVAKYIKAKNIQYSCKKQGKIMNYNNYKYKYNYCNFILTFFRELLIIDVKLTKE